MILSARGAFYQVSLLDATNSSKSVYAVDKLTINVDTTSPKSPILIDGIRTRESDIVSRTPCLNNFKVYYSFGQNFGDISVSGVVLLGPMGDVNTDGVKRLRDFFAKYRVSEYQQTIVVNAMDKSYSMFLEGIQIMEVDRDYHVMPFALFGTQVDLSRTAPPNVNPNTVVLADKNLDDKSLAAALNVTQPNVPDNASGNKTTTVADNSGAARTSGIVNNDPLSTIVFPVNGTPSNLPGAAATTVQSGTPINTLGTPPITNAGPMGVLGPIVNPIPADTYSAVKTGSNTPSNMNAQAAVANWNSPHPVPTFPSN